MTLDPAEEGVSLALEGALAPLGFVPREHPPKIEGHDWLGLWVRKTWQTNRAVAVLRLPDGVSAAPLTQPVKFPIGKVAGYFPLFYGVGLQVVWVGWDCVETTQEELQRSVDTFDNQRCIVQSVFVADAARKHVVSARTWGQVITGRFQDAIQAALEAAVAARDGEGV